MYTSPGIVAESDLNGNLKSEYVFFDGERVARKDLPGSSVIYYFSDHLKIASVITDSAGTIKEDEDYYPWGGELQFVNNDSNHYKFGGHERDQETGLDYMLARYYSNPLGRFLTPDWAAKAAAVPYAEFSDPQSLNLYSYVRNIPTSKADPDGHFGEGDDSSPHYLWLASPFVLNPVDTANSIESAAKGFVHFMTSGHPHLMTMPTTCPSPCPQNQNSQSNNSKESNNSYQQNTKADQLKANAEKGKASQDGWPTQETEGGPSYPVLVGRDFCSTGGKNSGIEEKADSSGTQTLPSVT